MEYKVVPFIANINQKKGNSSHVAEQLGKLINEYASQGWNYVRLEDVTTYVAPDNGCFGIGAQKSFNTVIQVVVFSR